MGWLKNWAARIAGQKAAKQLNLQEGDVVDKKAWYKSKTVWAGVLTVVIAVYEAAKPPVEQAFGVVLPPIPGWAYAFLGGLGVYGRVTTTQGIK